MPQAPTITISLDLFHDLMEARNKLDALENAGVDNWEWYDDAMAEYWEERENRERSQVEDKN